MKTLNEVADIVGLTRRAIQEYEVAGLAKKPETKNKYGYLLYDTPDIEQLWQLRFYKELGYNIPKIQSVFADKSYNTEEELGKVINELAEKKKKIENMINIATMMKETGLNFNALRHEVDKESSFKADEIFSLLGDGFKYLNFHIVEDNLVEVWQDDDYEEMYTGTIKITRCYKKEIGYDSNNVQKLVEQIHGVCKKGISDSIIILRWFLAYLEPGTEIYEDLIGDTDEKTIEYVKNAFAYYCDINADNQTDADMMRAFDNIGKLGMAKYKASSKEVQDEVRKLHYFFDGVKIYQEDIRLEWLMNTGKAYGSQGYKDVLDNGRERGVVWFLSKAIEIYCENYKKA